MKLRTTPLDPYYEDYFEGRQRVLDIQFQSRFKEKVGLIYMGLELQEQISLKFFLKGLFMVFIKFMKTFSPTMEYSFGSEGVLPFIVFPLHELADRLVITPPGKEPPKLGVGMLPKTNDKEKMNKGTFPGYDDKSTYSFSWHTMYLDLLKWRVTNLPASVPEIDLHRFWKDTPIRFVAYELKGTNGIHSNDQKRYFFCISFEHLKNEELVWPEVKTPHPQHS